MEQDYPGGRGLVRKALELRGVPEESMNIILSSLTDNSYKQYETCFKKWWYFCVKMKLSPYDGSINNVLKFLTEVFQSGAASGSVNCYRSAVSLLVGPEMAENITMKRFFRGLRKIDPPQPKYDTIWDPKIVLDYLSGLSSNEDLSIKDLSEKLVCLLALITGHRMQTLSLIRIENIEKEDELIQIKISDPIKTSGLNRKQPLLILPYFSENKKLCVASALECYIQRTNNNRNNIKFLFISLKKPFKAVTTQTLSRWTKEILKKSGLNTSIFTAHSTRHASTSAAKRNGVDIDNIRKTASWTEKSNTFANFYNLSLGVEKDLFAKAVLGKTKSK